MSRHCSVRRPGPAARHGIVLVLALATAAPMRAAPPPDPPAARAILECAVDRAAWVEREGFMHRFGAELRWTTEKLDGDDRVEEREVGKYRTELIEGEPYLRLLQKDGAPLTPVDHAEELSREREFRKALSKPDRDDDRLRLDHDLISRYATQLLGVDEVSGRMTWEVAFAPLPDLDEKHRIDRALNHVFGRIWIDQETYDLAGIEFELAEPVRVWWGILGKLSALRGSGEQAPLAGKEAWFPAWFKLYVDGRIVLRSLHERVDIEWLWWRPLGRDGKPLPDPTP